MAIKEKMYKEIQLWKSSGKNKASFIKDKNYSKAKFEYWIDKYNKENIKPVKSSFKEIPITKPTAIPAVKNEKLVELDLPSGVKITVYR